MLPLSIAAKSVWIQSVLRPSSVARAAKANANPTAAPKSRKAAGAISCKLAGARPPCSAASILCTPNASARTPIPRSVSCPSIFATACRRRHRGVDAPAITASHLCSLFVLIASPDRKESRAINYLCSSNTLFEQKRVSGKTIRPPSPHPAGASTATAAWRRRPARWGTRPR